MYAIYEVCYVMEKKRNSQFRRRKTLYLRVTPTQTIFPASRFSHPLPLCLVLPIFPSSPTASSPRAGRSFPNSHSYCGSCSWASLWLKKKGKRKSTGGKGWQKMLDMTMMLKAHGVCKKRRAWSSTMRCCEAGGPCRGCVGCLESGIGTGSLGSSQVNSCHRASLPAHRGKTRSEEHIRWWWAPCKEWCLDI